MPTRSSDTDRSFTHGSSASTADMAVEGKPSLEDRHIQTPHARKAEPLADDEKHDQLADKEAASEDRQEALLDEAIEESFPGSDPISPSHIT
ncbi:hypothetical protein [Phenylobacterium sp.]|uniref:hypothetical protein n=1 Tax=Phenylobacterium sp. TaxID=1871053 RepID=UPI0027354493|nr:hypothetical protein [Phenylobacterium sp.]MDP3173942.1 hypothetical protein [Phenylobacterium sp.]MDP3660154.1 hypothetical protein [Phenylobacterium sp.]